MRIRLPFLVALVLVISLATLKSCNLKYQFVKILKKFSHSQQSQYSKLLEDYQKQYRLTPDRRFLTAVALLDPFFTGKQNHEIATAKWNNTGWDIFLGSKKVGHVAEFADYPEYTKILSDRARILNQSYPLNLKNMPQGILTDAADFINSDMISRLSTINKSWENGQHTQELFKQACQALVYLTIQSSDAVGLGDEVPAQAWAILSAYQAITQDTIPQEEVLLAEHLSYTNFAAELSKNLAPNDPIRAYIQHDLGKLQELKDQKMAQYLEIKALIKSDRIEEALNLMKINFRSYWKSKVFLKMLVDADSFTINRVIFNLIPAIILSDLKRENGQLAENNFGDFFDFMIKNIIDPQENFLSPILRKALGLDKSGKIDELYKQLALVKTKTNGPFLTSTTIAAFYESFFYSGLYVQGIFYLDQLSSEEGVKAFNDEIHGGRQKNKNIDTFIEWFDILTASNSGMLSIQELLNRVQQVNKFSPAQFDRLIDATKGLSNFGEPQVNLLVRELFQKLDARPQNVFTVAHYTLYELRDVPMAERMTQRGLNLSSQSSGYYRALYGYLKNDTAQIKTIVNDESLKLSNRVAAVNLLEGRIGPEKAKPYYEMLFQKHPDNFSLVKSYADSLIKTKNYAQARAISQGWIDQDKTSLDLKHINMIETVAETYYEEGLFLEGYNYIEPYISGQKARTYILAIKFLHKLSRNEEALSLLDDAFERYPFATSLLALRLKLAWEAEQYDEAVNIIKEWRFPLTNIDWLRDIVPSFIDVFKAKPKIAAREAFNKLLVGQFDLVCLGLIPRSFHETGNSQLAFELNSMINMGGLQGLEIFTSSYTYLKNYAGENEAKKWLFEIVPNSMRNPLTMFLYAKGHYDLIWEAVSDSESEYGDDFVWLLKTAAWLKSFNNNTNHYTRLQNYYQKHKESYYNKIGLYLLNMGSAEDVIDEAGSQIDRICEFTYYFAIKAEIDGKLEEASAWYHLCVNTGMMKEGEYRWSLDRLYSWEKK